MSFPGLERCEHGEYRTADCAKCETERLRAEVSLLQSIVIAYRKTLPVHQWQIIEEKAARTTP